MHQSAVRSSRPLAARGCCWSGRERRSLPFVRRFPPQRAAAARSALAYAPALTLDAPARPAPALNRAPWSLRPPVPLLKLAHAAGPRAGDPFLAFCILLYFQIRIQKTYGNSLALGIVREEQEASQQRTATQPSTRPFSRISSSVSHRSGMLAEPRRRMSSNAPRTSRR